MRAPERLQLGVIVTARTASEYGSRALAHALLEARTHGFNAVTFTPTWYVSTPTASDLAPDPVLTTTDAALSQAMAAATRFGLSTVLRPQVDLPGFYQWRSTIDPDDRRSWWTRYGAMIEHYATLAQSAGAETFVVGTEFEGLTGARDDSHWRALVTRVRARFGGTVTYSTGGYRDPDRVTFWDQLDAIGVALRPELGTWTDDVRALRELRDSWSRPVLLTELGLRIADPEQQASAYDATYRALAGETWLTGMHWWSWPSDLVAARRDDSGQCPFGRPAGDLAARWNRRLAARSSERPLMSVVVPVRNGEETIAACLEALLAQQYPRDRYEIVVVDNASTDRTKEIVARYQVSYVHEPDVGRSHARNRGVAESRGEIVAFVDADCIADQEWLRELCAAFDREPVSAVAGEILADQPASVAQRFMAQREARWQSVVLALPRPFAITANVAFRREVFEHVGPFDPIFVTAEDVDFGWRFFDAGFRMSYAPTATVSHQLRRTAWQLFRQQEGLGYGRVLLRERYRLAPDYGSPSGADLRRAAGELLRSARARNRPSDEQTAFAFYELLRLTSLRTGALRRELVSQFAPCPAA